MDHCEVIFLEAKLPQFSICAGGLNYRLLAMRASEQGNWASEASPTLGCSIEISRDIYTKYSTLPRGISVYIEPKVGIFSEAEGRGKYCLLRVQYMPIFHKEGF